jgi:thiamine pyrophosphate-dependent acetolactate synthase large subunit-like protein
MGEPRGGRAVVDLLKAEGVRYIFGIVGATFLDVLDALYDDHSVEYTSRPEPSWPTGSRG